MIYKKALTVAMLSVSFFSLTHFSGAYGWFGRSQDSPETRLINISQELYAKVQIEGNTVIYKFMVEKELTGQEGLAVLRIAAQIAEKNQDKITRKFFEVEHEKLLKVESWYWKGTGFVGRSFSKAVAIGMSPFKKGFDQGKRIKIAFLKAKNM